MKRLLQIIAIVCLCGMLLGAASVDASDEPPPAAENVEADENPLTPNTVASFGIIIAAVMIVFFRYFSTTRNIRKKLLHSRSAYKRKNFQVKPRAFDEDDSTGYRDL